MSEHIKNGRFYGMEAAEAINPSIASISKRSEPNSPLALAAKCVGAFALVAALVGSGVTTPIDVWVVSQTTTLTSSTGLLTVANLMSGLASVPCLAAVIIVSSYLLGKSRSQRLTIFAVQIANLLGAGILNVALKSVFARLRPEIALVAETGWSFPSGHSMIAMAAYGLLIVLVIKFAGRNHSASRPQLTSLPYQTSDSKKPAPSKLVIAVLAAAIVLVGLSRVLLGVHYPTDVLGGFLASAAWVLLVDSLLLETRKARRDSAKQHTIAGAPGSDRSFGHHVPSQSF